MKDHLPHDFDEELDGDTVWELLKDCPSSQASPNPTFVQDTLRRARLEPFSAKPWWQALLSPKLILGTTMAACAAITLVVSLLNGPPVQPEPSLADEAASVEWNELEDAVANELLVGVTEDPSLLSDEEIVALIF
ncbi:MAG: hypothetical protein ACON5H_00465 [Akkermansiaceae bacterium]